MSPMSPARRSTWMRRSEVTTSPWFTSKASDSPAFRVLITIPFLFTSVLSSPAMTKKLVNSKGLPVVMRELVTLATQIIEIQIEQCSKSNLQCSSSVDGVLSNRSNESSSPLTVVEHCEGNSNMDVSKIQSCKKKAHLVTTPNFCLPSSAPAMRDPGLSGNAKRVTAIGRDD